MKVHVYYQDKFIYAYTTDKNIKKQFDENRNLDVLHLQTLNMSKEEYLKLERNFPNLKIENIAYHDGNDYYYILSTNKEEDMVMTFTDKVIEEIEDLLIVMKRHELKNKYMTAIEELLTITETVIGENGQKDLFYSLNTMYVFTVLFSETLKL